ncbi:phage tail protein I [Altererythrobacter xixiisoli]|uniref:Phage tail protein I n=1 Tax=Croceibacterium xixiisoli TaxID=1476466 RepID=A0A6I4TZA4_9SPHN|nr:phage tail protein I [Croceibacterium xixiisoli]MXP00460.1 phage tail protein I [Croceibacterium xixiisoli]
MSSTTILPPGSTQLERALEQVAIEMLDIPVPVRSVWSADDCPNTHLPWLAYGLSVDNWADDWSEPVRREAIRQAIPLARVKGTRAALRAALDRHDPAIAMHDWFEADPPLPPHHFRLDLPIAADSDVVYNEQLVSRLLRDIESVKPVRSHMQATQRLNTEVAGYLMGVANPGGFIRSKMTADTASALDPIWDSFLQTENGEPLTLESGAMLEHE